MLSMINKIPNDFRENLNVGIINKDYDHSVVEYVVDAFKGLEILPSIKIIDWEFIADEDKFDINDHVVRRNTNKNKVIKHIAETRAGVLYIDAEITGTDANGQRKVMYIKKPIMIPLMDKHGYYKIKGKDYYLIYQMVDKMMYPSLGAVTIKSLMPICVKTSKYTIHDVDGKHDFTVPIYTIQIFKNAINVLLIYSNIMITKTLNFLEVYHWVKIINPDDFNSDKFVRKENCFYFKCPKRSNLIVEVDKNAFEEFIYVRSIVGCLISLFEEYKVKYDLIDDWEFWMVTVGGKNTVKRGIYQHIFFTRLLDDVTQKELKINEYDKQNIYYLLRWILQNYHTLWQKDNLSMINKRLRCNEYVGALMTAEISKRINRLVSLGDRATLKDLLSIWKFPEDILFTRIYGSGILRFNEVVNDLDGISKLKFTKKGPNSLGGTDVKRIPIRQRILHPSMIGYLDVAYSSASDPGQGGFISPWANMDSLYFDNSLAENELHFKIKEYLDKNDNNEYDEICIKCDNEKQYNEILDSLSRYTKDKIQIYGTTEDNLEIIIERDPRENYRKFDEKYVIGLDDND